MYKIGRDFCTKLIRDWHRSGYKVSRIIRINNFLYQAERYILIDGKVYKVIKTYEPSHLLELTLESTNLKVEGKWLV